MLHGIIFIFYICNVKLVCKRRYLEFKKMKLTVNINLGGSAFNMDDDAYERLRQYLKLLEKEFTGEPGGAEILSDIEGRIAELFRMRLTSYKQVITIKDVEEVIAILGSPEVISGGEAAPEPEPPPRRHRRIYRDPERRIIGGVCAGISSYLDWDPLILRIIFAALIFAGGFGPLLYIILWILLPEAKTTAQKLEMRGDPVTVENIKESVKKEFETVRKKMNL